MTSPDRALSLDDRIDIACDRFERAWGSDTPLAIEDLLPEFSGSEYGSALRELLGVELELRLNRGETFRKQDYLKRWPEHSALVAELFDSEVGQLLEKTPLDRSSDQALVSTHIDLQARAAGVPDMIGKYRVVEALDRGGQAVVYRAIHPDLHRDVVIKFCHVESTNDPSSQETLASEGRVLASLEHPNLARVYDFDWHENRAFLVMEYIRGLNLFQFKKQSSPAPETWIPLVRQVAEALSYIHEHGVLHLDIKPQNILIDETGKPRLIDFGLARAETVWQHLGPDPTTLSGTLAFMSPEQACCDAEAVGPPSDVFGLGGVMYFLATGRPPISGADFDQVYENARSGNWDQDLLQESCDDSLCEIIESAMAPEPEQRIGSGRQLARRLAALETKPGWSIQSKLGVGLILIAGLLTALIALTPTPSDEDGPLVLPSGEIEVRVWRDGQTFDLTDSVPVAGGDRVAIRSEILPGFHVSLFLFDSAGQLQLVESIPAASEPYEFRYPTNRSQFERIVGPAGTEFLFLCGRRESPVTIDELLSFGLFAKAWPQLPDDSVIQIRSDGVEFLQRGRGFGGGIDTVDPQQQVYDQLEMLRAKLEQTSDFVEGIAFSHFE